MLSMSLESGSAMSSMFLPLQVLFGGEVDPSDKGHAGAGQFSNDTYCYDPSKVSVHFSLRWVQVLGSFMAL
jgi:hypothetical protein